jgi:hypothetical protein
MADSGDSGSAEAEKKNIGPFDNIVKLVYRPTGRFQPWAHTTIAQSSLANIQNYCIGRSGIADWRPILNLWQAADTKDRHLGPSDIGV